MTIGEIRGLLERVPKEMDGFQLIFRTFDDEGDNVLFSDYPLTSLYFDESSKEVAFLDEDNWNYFQSNLLIDDGSGDYDDYEDLEDL